MTVKTSGEGEEDEEERHVLYRAGASTLSSQTYYFPRSGGGYLVRQALVPCQPVTMRSWTFWRWI